MNDKKPSEEKWKYKWQMKIRKVSKEEKTVHSDDENDETVDVDSS